MDPQAITAIVLILSAAVGVIVAKWEIFPEI